MSTTVAPTQTQIFTALVAVLKTFGLLGTDGQPLAIIRGQVNRVPEPTNPDFIVLWPVARERLAMNSGTYADNQFTGSITANVLTITATILGAALPGQTIYGSTVSQGCQIVRQLTGTAGGIGTYQTTPTAAATSQTLYTGTVTVTQETEITIQADVHGLPGATGVAADNAARISTLFRDQFGVFAFAAQGIALAPLYTSDPREMPFDNAEQQVEERWVIDLCMQASVAVTATQQFADQLHATAEAVFAVYPA